MVRKAVTVRMADIRWFMKDLFQFLKFCELLKSAQSDTIFGTELVKYTLEEFWYGCYTKLFYGLFIPYCVCLTSTILFIKKAFGN